MRLQGPSSSSTEESSEDYGEEVYEFDWILPDFRHETRQRIDSEIFEKKTKWCVLHSVLELISQATYILS
jgi:hypothetical protein